MTRNNVSMDCSESEPSDGSSENEEDFSVKEIIGTRKTIGGTREYLVVWENTWQCEESTRTAKSNGTVEKIMEQRTQNEKVEYLVSWKPTWEPERNVENSFEFVREFWKKHSGTSASRPQGLPSRNPTASIASSARSRTSPSPSLESDWQSSAESEPESESNDELVVRESSQIRAGRGAAKARGDVRRASSVPQHKTGPGNKSRKRKMSVSLPSQSSEDECSSPPRLHRKTKRAKHEGKTNVAIAPTTCMTMAEYLWLPCWDALVKQIDSYDRGQEGRIRINFTLQDGTKRNELSEVCRERFPHKLIVFYESLLQ